MNTREILSIVALAALGLCLLCGLAKMAMKGPKAKQSCDHACSLLVFVAVVLVGVSQLLEENKDGYEAGPKWGTCQSRSGDSCMSKYYKRPPGAPIGACDMTKKFGGTEDCWGDGSCCCAPVDYANCCKYSPEGNSCV